MYLQAKVPQTKTFTGLPRIEILMQDGRSMGGLRFIDRDFDTRFWLVIPVGTV